MSWDSCKTLLATGNYFDANSYNDLVLGYDSCCCYGSSFVVAIVGQARNLVGRVENVGCKVDLVVGNKMVVGLEILDSELFVGVVG